MAQSRLQHITTTWSHIKNFRMKPMPAIEHILWYTNLKSDDITFLSRYHLKQANRHIKQAKVCLDRDVAEAKLLIKG